MHLLELWFPRTCICWHLWFPEACIFSLYPVSHAPAWSANVQRICVLQPVYFFFFLKASPTTDVEGLF